MREPIGMGVVGAGAIGIRGALMHLSQPDVADRARLAAVCDPVPGRARAAAERFGVAAAYEGYEELLADPRVDAVTLCSPIGLHYEQGVGAIEAGKHVHFNKTMATKVAECDDLVARAAARGVRLVASPGMMLMPFNRRIRKRILQGDIGKLTWAITGTSPGNYHLNEEFRKWDDVLTQVDPTWYFRRPGGGPMYDVTVYCLHNLTGILGPAKRVTAMSGLAIPQREFRGQTIQCDMDDTTFSLVDFGDSLFAVVYGAAFGSVTKGFHPNVYGTAGAVIGTEVNGQPAQLEGDHQPHVVGEHAKLRESHVFEDLMQLVDWVRDGTPSIASAEHARHVIDIIESSYRSAATGQAQDLRTTFEPLKAEDCA
ncbi:MAG: Gfo/Idh/MocA family oxidoreductase [Planctomycetes bacterium]|nr:Gfo/Idh/MocA family oxidoreductase [Planctomycetota bacterium]